MHVSGNEEPMVLLNFCYGFFGEKTLERHTYREVTKKCKEIEVLYRIVEKVETEKEKTNRIGFCRTCRR